ncbi:MAG TPA: hypothetical protein ENH23_07890 [candidate division Zixibacteria bacterium]|nr:hypothetical protein [candidate division Zixibacteria bacterium]
MSKIPQQLIPLAIILVIVIGVFIAATDMFVPESFGKLGHFRADAIQENMALEQVYAGSDACYDCHDDIVETKSKSYHKGLACEVCHGAAMKHIDSPEDFIPNAPRGRGYCPLCHGYNPSRPSGFPQIIADRHNPGKACMSCHNPHNPLLPNAPEECAACHREISNLKMLSHHATLPCTQCHTIEKGHKTSPKFSKAHKPTDNTTCANCHEKGSSVNKDAPKLNTEEHSERYLCWDCHYPHYPEAN